MSTHPLRQHFYLSTTLFVLPKCGLFCHRSETQLLVSLTPIRHSSPALDFSTVFQALNTDEKVFEIVSLFSRLMKKTAMKRTFVASPACHRTILRTAHHRCLHYPYPNHRRRRRRRRNGRATRRRKTRAISNRSTSEETTMLPRWRLPPFRAVKARKRKRDTDVCETCTRRTLGTAR